MLSSSGHGGLVEAGEGEELMADPEAVDPVLFRAAFLAGLHDHPVDRQRLALVAIDRGEVDIDDRPEEGRIVIQIGDLTVTVDRDECTRR